MLRLPAMLPRFRRKMKWSLRKGDSMDRQTQRFENWGARRAALRPYFLRSFMRGSRVR